MNRGLLAPRWLAVHGAVLVGVLGCALLGAWQVDRAGDQRDQAERSVSYARLAPVDLATVLPPGTRLQLEDVGRPVEVRGTYDAEAQLVVPDRDLGGQPGSLVLTPLVPDDGSTVIVVRGWRPSGADTAPPPPPAGPVIVTGWLGASEDPPGPEVLPAGHVQSVHVPSLVNLVPYALRDGFVAATAEAPPPASGDALTYLPPPVPVAAVGLPLQNVFYAVEWWVFGLAAIVLWVSAIRRRDDPLNPPPLPGRPTPQLPVDP